MYDSIILSRGLSHGKKSKGMEILSVRVDSQVKARLQKIADAEHRTLSNLVQMLLNSSIEHLLNHELARPGGPNPFLPRK